MNTIILITLLAATIFFAIGWLASKISLMAILWYLDKKRFPFPNSDEMRTGTQYVMNHMLKDLFHK